MNNTVVSKLTFEEIFNSATMFFVDSDFEAKMEQEIQRRVDDLYYKLQGIGTKGGLKEYIISNKDSLDNITSLMEISTERFKRMVSMIRKDRGFVFQTEWSLSKIRSAMMESPAMMDSIINMIYDGRNDEKLKQKIPSFYLDNMVINNSTMKKLTDKDSIRLFVKKGLEGKYSNGVSDVISNLIESKLKAICNKHGLEYQKEVRVPAFDRAVSFVLEDPHNPVLVLDISYSVTTSSAQGDKKTAARRIEEAAKKRRAEGKPCTYINFLDGAGWIARQADMKEIYRASDYMINFNNLDMLEDIITSHIEDFTTGGSV